MSETLIIKNFGPIVNMTLELRVVNILIGDQGTGKSTVAKLLSVIKAVNPEMSLNINGKPANDEQKMEHVLLGFIDQLETYGIVNYLKLDSYIEFRNSLTNFKYDKQKINVSTNLKGARDKNTHVIEFIPAYREAAILLKDATNALAALQIPLPKYFYFFGQKLVNAKLAKALYNYSEIFDIQYKYANNRDIIVLKSGIEIAMSEASSAINSGIPLLTVFDNAVESNQPSNTRITHHRNCPYIVIEEPELNCFPSTQKKMMEHLISKIKFDNSDGLDYYCKLLITTHSPYILTSLNNMIYAYQTGQKHGSEVEKIVPKENWMNPSDVSAYMMMPNGECENILDSEGLIKTEKIDSVSSVLNKDFNTIMDIELSINQ